MKNSSIIVALLCIIFSSQSVFAHPPQGVKRLSKIAFHSVNEIIVEFDDEEIVTQKNHVQGSEDAQVASYILPDIKIGDTLEAVVFQARKNKAW